MGLIGDALWGGASQGIKAKEGPMRVYVTGSLPLLIQEEGKPPLTFGEWSITCVPTPRPLEGNGQAESPRRGKADG